MKVQAGVIPDVLLLEPRVMADERGHFMEVFNAGVFAALTGLQRHFMQDNHSFSQAGVLRGLHYQLRHPQGKLVRVVAGAVFDVAVDLRRSSPTFGRWQGTVLSAENRLMQWIPEGFAHGFLVLSDTADVLYKVTDRYDPESQRSLRWDDADIGIEWPLDGRLPRLSARDRQAPVLRHAETFA